MQEDDVEHDPADGQQTSEAAVQGSIGRHFAGHAIHHDGDHQGGHQTSASSDVCFHMEEAQTRQHDHHRHRGEQCGQKHVAQWVVYLLPYHVNFSRNKKEKL